MSALELKLENIHTIHISLKSLEILRVHLSALCADGWSDLPLGSYVHVPSTLGTYKW